MAMTLEELNKRIEDYIAQGFYRDVAAAVEEARWATRHFVARTHPQTGFGGRNLIKDDVRGKSQSQILVGKFDIHADFILSNIYGNYFARWYNTGAFGRTIRGDGPRKGERGPEYPAHDDYFEKNKAAIEEYYRKQLEENMQKRINL